MFWTQIVNLRMNWNRSKHVVLYNKWDLFVFGRILTVIVIQPLSLCRSRCPVWSTTFVIRTVFSLLLHFLTWNTRRCLPVTDSTTLTFNGSQHMLITMPDEFHTQAEDVTLRFRTTRPLGLLLTTNTEQSADRLELALMGGRVRLVARLGDREKVRQCTSIVTIWANALCETLIA